jgi:hypothetical protein
MVECEMCGAKVSGGSAFCCSYCEGTFCPAHRLPFNHACPNIEEWKRAKPKEKRTVHVAQSVIPHYDKQSIIAGGVIVLFLIVIALLVFRFFQ